MKSKKNAGISKIVIGVVAIAIIVVASVGVYLLTQTPEEKVLTVGIPAPLTGPWSADGESYPKAATMFFEEKDWTMNVGGETYKIEMVTGDTEDLETGKVHSVFEKMLTRDKVDVIITSYASQVNSEIDIVKDYGIPYLLAGSPSCTRDILLEGGVENYWMIYSYHPLLYAIADSLPLWTADMYDKGILTPRDGGDKFKVAMGIYDIPYAEWWSDRMKEDFDNLGIFDVILDEKWPVEAITDWSGFLSKVRADPPDLLVFGDSQSSNAITFIDQFLEDPIDGCYVWLVDTPTYADFRDALGDSGNGILTGWLGGGFSEAWEPWTSFKQKYEARWNQDVTYQASVVYYECQIWWESCMRAGNPKDYQAVCEEIAQGTWDNLAIGTVKYRADTHLADEDTNLIPAVMQELWDEGNGLTLYNIWPESVAFADYQDPPWFSAQYQIADKFG
jgi:branched-chain amino acid transport system substrate-binding protein